MRGRPRSERLSEPERRVLRQASRGLTSPQSAAESFHALGTVAHHRKNARRKLGAANVTESVAKAIRAGEIEPPPRKPGGPF